MRTCEGCHGLESLHLIQVDSDGDDEIIAGSELSFYGHIGNGPDDCMGCHGFSSGAAAMAATATAMAAAAPGAAALGAADPGYGPVVPDIHTYTPSVVTAGEDTSVVITGVALTNIVPDPDGPITLTSDVVLESREGDVLLLDPVTITQSTMEVVIPGSLEPGIYALRAQKETQFSSKHVLVVKPPVVITAVECNKKAGLLSINGTGFGETIPEALDYINVEIDGVPAQQSDYILWTDTSILLGVARCPKNPQITVKALLGSATFGGGSDGKPPKPCRGKKC
jgi:hypothetical protein